MADASKNPYKKNVLEDVGSEIKTVALDVVHGIEDVIGVGEKVIAVVKDGETLEPVFKQEFSVLMADLQPIAAVLAPVVASQGENPVADVQAVVPLTQDVIKLARDFLAFLPTLEKAYQYIQTAAKS